MSYDKLYNILSDKIINSCEDPIICINDNGDIIYYNNSLYDYVDDDDILNIKVYRLASDIKKSDWVHLWEKLKIKKNISFKYFFHNKVNDINNVFDIKSYYITIDGAEYCYIIAKDITKLENVKNNIKIEKNKRLDIENTSLKHLLRLSAEIRTPMNAILGFSEILYNNIREEYKEYTSIISRNVDDLLTLLNNNITISELMVNKIAVNHKLFNTKHLFEDMEFHYKTRLAKSDKDINIIVDDITNQIINSDKYIIEYCLTTLIDNSIKFMDCGNINIGYNIIEDEITFYVSDDGIGINKKFHEVIFERLYQIDEYSPGTGLGLSIYSTYVMMLGGSYNIKSSVNCGTTIEFTIKINYKNYDTLS